MNGYNNKINEHYGGFELSSRIVEKLKKAGKDLNNLSRDDLSLFDEFHTGGIESTRELAKIAGITEYMSILDIGSGIGGPARTLAAEFNCFVIGLDLTEEFCVAAEMLTKFVKLNDKVSFKCGNAVDMPFEEERFDCVWSQNTLMNIENKEQLFHQIFRVLKPGGIFVFEAMFQGKNEGIYLPTFWASSPEINFLIKPESAYHLLISAGFKEKLWLNKSEQILIKAKARKNNYSKKTDSLGREVIVPENTAAKIQNSIRNGEENRVVPYCGIFSK